MTCIDTQSLAEAEYLSEVGCRARSILICDDEPDIIALFRSILQISLPGCKIDTARNGREALDLFTDTHHKIILMDLHMPVMDGQCAYHEIMRFCSENNWEKPSFIFCTGFAPPTVIRDIVSSDGPHTLLTKPTPMRVLVRAVTERLE